MEPFIVLIFVILMYAAVVGMVHLDHGRPERPKCPPHRWEDRKGKLACKQCGWEPQNESNT